MFGLLWFDGRKPGQNEWIPRVFDSTGRCLCWGEFIFNFAFLFSLLFYFSLFLFFFTLSKSGKCTAETKMWVWVCVCRKVRARMYGDVLAAEMYFRMNVQNNARKKKRNSKKEK